jgi:hypothetical protein
MPKERDCELLSEVEERLQSDEGVTVEEYANILADKISERVFINLGRKEYARRQLRKKKARSVFIKHIRGRRAYRKKTTLTPEQAKQMIREDGTLVLALEGNITDGYRILGRFFRDLDSGQGFLNIEEHRRIAEQEIRKAQARHSAENENLNQQAAQG